MTDPYQPGSFRETRESLVSIQFPIPISADLGRQLWFSLHMVPGLNVIDIGGGTGWIVSGYPGKTTIVDDLSGVPPKEKVKIPSNVVQGDAHELPQFKDDQFDIALVGDVIEHLTDPQITLAEAARVAKYVLISTPYEYEWGYGKPAFQVGGHMRYYTKQLFLQTLREAGLRARVCKLLFGGWAFWMAQAWAEEKPMPRDELKYWADKQAHGIRYWVFGDMELYVATKEVKIMDLDGGIFLRIPIKQLQAHEPVGQGEVKVAWRDWPERDRE